MYKGASQSMQKSRGIDLKRKVGRLKNPTTPKEARRFWFPVIEQFSRCDRPLDQLDGTKMPDWLKNEVRDLGAAQWLSKWMVQASPALRKKYKNAPAIDKGSET